MAEGQFHKEGCAADYTPAVAVTAGEVVQLPDGRAALAGRTLAAGVKDAVQVKGIVRLAKTANINLLQGQKVYWDVSASTATYKQDTATQDFKVGYAAADSLAAATTVDVVLNEVPNYAVDLRGGRETWTTEATNGLGVTALVGGGVTAAFDAVAEAAQAAIFADRSVDANKGWILEGTVGVWDIGNNAALDINVGMANGSHATDADAITESVFLHFDETLDIWAESDDGTTEVAATDTTVNAVDNTYFTFLMDGRDPADIQIYINGVNVLPNSVFKLDAATGPLVPIVHMEKTSDDTSAEFRVRDLTLRTCEAT